MSPKLQLPKRGQTTNAPSATGPAPRKTTSGPSSSPCWTSNRADLTLPSLTEGTHEGSRHYRDSRTPGRHRRAWVQRHDRVEERGGRKRRRRRKWEFACARWLSHHL